LTTFDISIFFDTSKFVDLSKGGTMTLLDETGGCCGGGGCPCC
jgi:hypothetical protein